MILEYVKKYERRSILSAAIMIFIGILLMVKPETMLSSIMTILGVCLLIDGAYSVILYIAMEKDQKLYSNALVEGMVEIIAALVVLINAHLIAAILVGIAAVWIIIKSIIKIQFSISIKSVDEKSWGKENGLEREEKRILISDRVYTAAGAAKMGCCLQLLPKNIVVGIGCRKGTDKEMIRQAVTAHLHSLCLSEEAIAGVASIDLKQEEEGILAFCREKQIPFMTYSAKQLQIQMGSFTASDFVEKVTGVDNVCERSVVASGAALLSGKRAENGVTTAVGEYQRSIVF